MLIDAREQGLDALISSGDLNKIKESINEGSPLILMLSVGSNNYHYVVVVGYEGDDASSIIVHDGYKSSVKYSQDKLNELWKPTGYFTLLIKKL